MSEETAERNSRLDGREAKAALMFQYEERGLEKTECPERDAARTTSTGTSSKKGKEEVFVTRTEGLPYAYNEGRAAEESFIYAGEGRRGHLEEMNKQKERLILLRGDRRRHGGTFPFGLGGFLDVQFFGRGKACAIFLGGRGCPS